MKHYRCFNIDYDTDGEKVDLPSSLIIEIHSGEASIDEMLANAISEKTGYCINSFNFEEIE